MLTGAISKEGPSMRPYIAAMIPVLGLAACDPRAHDSPGAATPPADAPAETPVLAAAAFDGNFKLVGTEPFWGLDIKGDQLLLRRPDAADVVAPRTDPVIDGQSAVWIGGALSVRLTPGACSDGMSDRRYTYTATVKAGEVSLSGCGDRPEALAAQPG
jgi:uncharacterized membrane protein